MDSEPLDYVEGIIDAVTDNPIRGIGYDNYGDYFLEKDYTGDLRDYTSPHNNYFLFLAETGFTGFFIFLYLSFYLIKLFYLSYIKIPDENSIDKALFLGILLAIIGFFRYRLNWDKYRRISD